MRFRNHLSYLTHFIAEKMASALVPAESGTRTMNLWLPSSVLSPFQNTAFLVSLESGTFPCCQTLAYKDQQECGSGFNERFRNRIMFCEEFYIGRHVLMPWITQQQIVNTVTHPGSTEQALTQGDATRTIQLNTRTKRTENKNPLFTSWVNIYVLSFTRKEKCCRHL